jgi:hypothetical protein
LLIAGRQVMNVTEPATAIPQCLLFAPDGKSIISGKGSSINGVIQADFKLIWHTFVDFHLLWLKY